MDMPIAVKSERVNQQIPIEVSIDVNSPITAENLNQSDAVKDLLDKMKYPLSKLDKEWVSIHQQLKHLPHSKMMRLVKAGHLDKKFLKVDKLRCPIVSFPLRLGPLLGTNPPRIKENPTSVNTTTMYLEHVYLPIKWCQLYLV